MKFNIFFSIWWITASCGFSLTSSINSLFSSRSIMSLTMRTNNEIMETISNGIQTAIDSCGQVFKWSRWNCPEFEFSRRRRQEATKEQAVVHAFISAGLAYAITKNCSRGLIPGCGCSNKHNKNQRPPHGSPNLHNYLATSSNSMKKTVQVDWTWGGCSDNVDYGSMIAQRLLDEIETGSDTQTNINLHNNQIGRMILQEGMVKRCRCHGVSGSCSLQTCWMQLAPFATTANKIRQKYGQAVKIYLENRSSRSSPSTSDEKAQPDGAKLVYIDESPDFCKFNNNTGWPGTKGRSCSRSRSDSTTFGEKKSCKNLCRTCGYKVRKIKREVQWNCNCRFKWCCEVQCETCTQIVDEYLCQ